MRLTSCLQENNEKLLTVKVSTKNEVSSCVKSSAKMNFRLINNFAKIKIKNKLKVKLNNSFVR